MPRLFLASLGGFESETVLDVERGPDVVFAFLADTRSFPALDPALVEVEPEGPLARGMTGRFLHRRAGFPARTTWQVVALEAPSRLVVELHGMGYAVTEALDLDSSLVGTRVRFTEHVRPTSFAGRLMVALSGGIMRRDLRARAARLKAVLEAPESAR
jgi:Polyketide cyclase / dehydrase and lipid transport